MEVDLRCGWRILDASTLCNSDEGGATVILRKEELQAFKRVYLEFICCT
jgi:hypothetical protein